MRKNFLFITLLLFAHILVAQKEMTPIQKDIRQLLEVTGSGELGKQAMMMIIPNFKKVYPNVPEKFWAEFESSVSAEELVELIIPIYEKHYTHEDVKGLLEFYTTPLGKKMIEKLPLITQESMTVGQAWGERIGKQVVEKMEREGYLKY